MFGFLIKKSFWDLWDNMGKVALANLFFTLMVPLFVFILYGSTYIAQFSFWSAAIAVLLIHIILFVYLGAISSYVKEISDARSKHIKTIWGHIKNTWNYSIGGGLLFYTLQIITILGMRFYSNIGGLIGMVASIFLFWVSITVLLASLYFFPVLNRLERNFFKIIKKCLLIFLDNPLLTIGLLLGIILNIILSLFTIFLLPGPTGALLWIDENLKILLYKYDYIEENPEASNKIPWKTLYMEDSKNLGPRTLSNTIFPWKY